MSSGFDLLDPLERDLFQGHRRVEGEAGEDRHLGGGVGAVDVGAGVGLGVTEVLGTGEDVLVGSAAGRHLGEDEVGGAVDDAEDLGDLGDAEALLDHPHDRDHARHCSLEAQLHAGLASEVEQLLPMLGEQLLVGRDHRALRPQGVDHVIAGGIGAADQLDDQVRALEDRAEVALLAGEHADNLRQPTGRRLDRIGARLDQLGEGSANSAASQQPDANDFRGFLRHPWP